jgi:branched-chain amino acid transport system substrate-binding protein
MCLNIGKIGHAETKPIRIGFVGDFSSVSQSYSRNAYKAAQMAVADFNAEGGLLGRPVQMIRRDGGNDPQRHYQHIADLAYDQKIVAVFGGASTPCLLRASAACRELHIPYLISIGNAQSVVVEYGHPFVFMFEPNARMESLGFSIFAALMPWRHYAWIGPDYSWGYEVLHFFKQNFKHIGVSIEWKAEIWHPLGGKDFSDSIQQIMAAKPDALIIASWGEDLRHFMLQARPSGMFEKMATFGWFSLLAGDSEHMLPEGIWKISRAPFNYLAEKHAQAGTFVKKFHERYNTFPLGFTVCCYDSFLAWRQAVRKAGSAEPADVAKTLKGMSFVGIRGESYIRAIDGQMNCPTFFGRVFYRPEYPFAILESVVEIPAAKTWMSEKEIIAARAGDQSRKKHKK